MGGQGLTPLSPPPPPKPVVFKNGFSPLPVVGLLGLREVLSQALNSSKRKHGKKPLFTGNRGIGLFLPTRTNPPKPRPLSPPDGAGGEVSPPPWAPRAKV